MSGLASSIPNTLNSKPSFPASESDALTLAELDASGKSVKLVGVSDSEKSLPLPEEIEKSTSPDDEFPDGGLRAWGTVFGVSEGSHISGGKLTFVSGFHDQLLVL